jgi:hypothetical protein
MLWTNYTSLRYYPARRKGMDFPRAIENLLLAIARTHHAQQVSNTSRCGRHSSSGMLGFLALGLSARGTSLSELDRRCDEVRMHLPSVLV